MRSQGSQTRVRLQRFLNDAGVASRRNAEELIRSGHVLVNDAIVDTLPVFIDPLRDVVIVNGARVKIRPPEYFILHKPKHVVCTNSDPAGRTRAVDLLPAEAGRLFVVGRLDTESTGLLLLTNDGELAQRVMHPRYGIPKLYRAELRGMAPNDLPATLKKGVWLAGGRARAAEVTIVHRGRDESIVHLLVREARNSAVRQMFARVGLPVRKLKRLMIGPLSIKGLPLGACRRLSASEIAALRAAITGDQGAAMELTAERAPRPRRPRRSAPRAPRSEAQPAQRQRGRATARPKSPPSDHAVRRRVVE